jgi:hypothetical protein
MQKKQLGVGAQCSVANKYLHPAKLVKDRYPNATAHSRVDKLLAIEQGERLVKKRKQVVISFRHDDFGTDILYCVKRWVRVETEGAPEQFFRLEPVAQVETVPVASDGGGVGIEANVFHAGNCAEDIALVRSQGLMVDDDRDPAPENVPLVDVFEVDNACSWGWDGICNRKITGATNIRPSFTSLHGTIMQTISYVTMFLVFFPRKFIEEVMIQEMNKHLEYYVTLGEVLRYIGLWLVIVKSSPGNMGRGEF